MTNEQLTQQTNSYLTITVLEDNTTISFKASNSDSVKTIYVSFNGGSTWTSYTSSTSGTTIGPLYATSILLIKGTNSTYAYTDVYNRITSDKTVNLSGNIMSLIYGDNFSTQKTLSGICTFNHIFDGLKVVDASLLVLPATTLVPLCYASMFQDCTSLTSAPELPATTLSDYCYRFMFQGCTSLTTAPQLPATALGSYCYAYMFKGCTSLVNAPELPATTLTYSCYSGMFQGCTSLVNAPELPATTLEYSCYSYMFDGCSNLKYIKASFTTTPSAEYTIDWVYGVANRGMFVKNAEWDVTGVTGVPTGWTIFNSKTSPFAISSLYDNVTVSFWASNSNLVKTISVSTDNGSTWTEYTSSTSGTTIATLNKNEMVLIKGSNSTYASNALRYTYFKSSNRVNIMGNIMSLIYGDNFIGQTTLTANYTFYKLFYNFNVKDASYLVLPATTLTDYCYRQMFDTCVGLTKAPELPATALGSYCYYEMFQGCISLTTVPKKLPATTLTQQCYRYMFYGCSNLTTAPELPATTLAVACYQQMFQDCTSLTKAPELPATTLTSNCYNSMFQGCTSLTTSPKLYATTLVSQCYNYMFSGCTSLNNITALFTTTPSTTYTNNWVSGVASTGRFWKNSNATWDEVGTYAVPVDWTISYFVIGYLAITALEDNTTISFKASNSDSVKTIYVSTDNSITWTEYTSSTSGVTIATLNTNDTVLIKGSNSTYNNNSFISDKTVDISGNIMSLIYGDEYYEHTGLTEPRVFANLFSSLKIVDASSLILPATTLTDYCYAYMFYNCTTLTSAPQLPATTLAPRCYEFMFFNCTSLVSAPQLPATTLAPYCYHYMFMNCTSLVNAPELPATTLVANCYDSMFAYCSSLITAPVLPAKYVPNNAYYNMFQYCNSLNFIEMLCISFEQSISTFTQYYSSSIGPTEGTFVADPTATWVNEYTVPQYWDIKRKHVNIGDCNIFYVDFNSNVHNVSALYLGSIPVQMTS